MTLTFDFNIKIIFFFTKNLSMARSSLLIDISIPNLGIWVYPHESTCCVHSFDLCMTLTFEFYSQFFSWNLFKDFLTTTCFNVYGIFCRRRQFVSKFTAHIVAPSAWKNLLPPAITCAVGRQLSTTICVGVTIYVATWVQDDEDLRIPCNIRKLPVNYFCTLRIFSCLFHRRSPCNSKNI